MASSKIVKPPSAAAAAAAKSPDDEKEQSIQELLSYIIFLMERINRAVMESKSFKSECSSLNYLVKDITGKLRNDAVNGSGKLYERPIRRIMEEVEKQFEKTLTLVRKCNRGGVFRRLMSIVSATDFKKIQSVLESSLADIAWLLNIFDGGGGIILSLPPIASNDPIISWVWAAIASLYMGQTNDKIEAANQLASLAKDNDRNKKYIVEEGGIAPLLKLLKDNSSVDAQIAGATALLYLANDDERVCAMIKELGVPIIVQVLGDSPVRVQIKLANLVAKMAESSPLAQEDFARENVIKPLVTLLLIDGYMEEASLPGRHSFHTIVEINKEREKNQSNRSVLGSSLSMHSSNGSSRGGHHKKDRENETPEVKLMLKTSCVEALWMLSRRSVLNSRKIAETKGLLCLAKLVEKEQGELLYNSLMTIMEITAAAESNADLRRTAFRTNSLAAKAVVDQLLGVIKEHDNPTLQVPAIRAIGSLARTFPARETRVIGPLVQQLGHWNLDVATEAAIALGKFTSPENFLRAEHSATILEFNGIQPLMRLLMKGNERVQLHGYILLCYLGLHARNSEALEQALVVKKLMGAERLAVVGQHPELKELIAETVQHLNLYLQCCVVQSPPYLP